MGPIHDTLIVGAGFTGIGAAIKLAQAGVDDVVILERSDRVGGTWRDNTYPGAACDIPSLCTRSRSSAIRRGRGPTPRPRRSAGTSRTWSTSSAYAVESGSEWRSTGWPSTSRPVCGP